MRIARGAAAELSVIGQDARAGASLPRVRRPTDDLARVAEDVLSCLPGISTVGELREVRAIRPIRATTLSSLLGHRAD